MRPFIKFFDILIYFYYGLHENENKIVNNFFSKYTAPHPLIGDQESPHPQPSNKQHLILTP